MGLVAFVAVWADVRWHGPVSAADQATYDAVSRLQAHGFPANAIGDWVSTPVSVPWAVAITALVVVWWWVLGERRMALWAAGSGIVVGAAIYGLKETIQRELPPRAAGAWYRFSFPSGHTISATANVGFLFLLGAQVILHRRAITGPRQRSVWTWAIVVWAAWAFVMGVARILSQRHWASDVYASWAIGLAIACGALLVAGVPRHPKPLAAEDKVGATAKPADGPGAA